MISETDRNYVIWQNRAFRFYLAARLLYEKEQYSPSAFCAVQSIEALMKATLIYWDNSFNPETANHKVAGMIRAIKNKAKDGRSLSCPEYFYRDKRFQSVTRYPANGKGIGIPSHFISDLDAVFYNLIILVPFQFNTELKRALSGKKKIDLNILRKKNQEMRNLREFLKVKLEK
jgi:HEPN domain-containing protein